MHAQYYLNICYFKWTLYLLCQNYPFKTGKNTSSNPLGISASPSHLCSSPNHQTANSYGYYGVTSQRTNLKFPFGFTSCSDSTHLTSFCRIITIFSCQRDLFWICLYSVWLVYFVFYSFYIKGREQSITVSHIFIKSKICRNPISSIINYVTFSQ